MERIRIVLIDDHVLFRESLSRFIASEPGMEIVGQCARSAELVPILNQSEVDVILLDFQLHLENGIELIDAARAAGYGGRFLFVTGATSRSEVLKALQMGASGVFLKHNSPESLLKAIQLVMSGEVWLDRRVVQMMADRVAPGEADAFGAALTERERQVMNGVMTGSSNREIADDLGVSEGAVKATLQQLFRKTGVRTRSQLVRFALAGTPAWRG